MGGTITRAGQQAALAIYVTLVAVTGLCLLLIYLGSVPPTTLAACSFAAVLAGALLLSWGAEAAEFLVSQGFAVAVVALLQVMPEFMVEGVIAYEGKVPLMMANLTGSNRLLMGVGWTLVFFTAFFSARGAGGWRFSVTLRRENVIEVLFLFLASMYFHVILLKRRLWLEDTAVLGALFLAYLWVLLRLPPEAEEESAFLPLPPRAVTAISNVRLRIGVVIGLFVAGGVTMILVAHPFLEGMEAVALSLGISTFVFVQWMAPFLTEIPEKITAFYWARSVRSAGMGLTNLISSKVNQWTLLVAMVPLMFWASPRGGEPIHLDGHQLEELFLSMAMSVYGAAALAKRRFTLENALVLFGLWFIQFVSPGRFVPMHDSYFDFPNWLWESWRGVTTGLFGLLTVLEAVRYWSEWDVRGDLRHTWNLIRAPGGSR